MKILQPICPKCGERACYVVEKLFAHAYIDVDASGKGDYAGESEMLWNTQEVHIFEDAVLPSVGCCNGHEWDSAIEDEDTPQKLTPGEPDPRD